MSLFGYDFNNLKEQRKKMVRSEPYQPYRVLRQYNLLMFNEQKRFILVTHDNIKFSLLSHITTGTVQFSHTRHHTLVILVTHDNIKFSLLSHKYIYN